MSDADLLRPTALRWEWKGKPYALAVRDIDAELFFQSIHEAFAVSRLDAIRARIGEASWKSRAQLQQDSIDANSFAFGGRTSVRFLMSREGFLEYALLLMQKAGGAPSREAFINLARSEAEDDLADWDRLAKLVLKRDFPNLLEPAKEEGPPAPGVQPSPAPAQPPPSISGSSSS